MLLMLKDLDYVIISYDNKYFQNIKFIFNFFFLNLKIVKGNKKFINDTT